MKIISLFNHKGGVSKTTTAFNLGWMLAEQGHKTLIVDADPQCNLTALVLDYNSVEDIADFYTNNPGCDLSTGLQPVMSGKLTGLTPGNPIQTMNENLYLYCGNLALSEIETQISVVPIPINQTKNQVTVSAKIIAGATMRKSRFTESQIVGILNEVEAGMKVTEVCRKHGITTKTYYAWKSKYGGMSVSDIKRLKELEAENAKLKKMFAEMALENHALKDLIEKKL